MDHLVISALGADRPGIVDRLSQAVLENGCNVADSRMTVLGGEFAIILLISGNWNTISKVEQQLPKLGQELELTITQKRTDHQGNSSPSLSYMVEVISIDQPGIVHHLANFFSARGINIQELNTSSYAAAHTGTPMFSLHMTVNVPVETHIATLRDQFLEFCEGQNLDAVIEPMKI